MNNNSIIDINHTLEFKPFPNASSRMNVGVFDLPICFIIPQCFLNIKGEILIFWALSHKKLSVVSSPRP